MSGSVGTGALLQIKLMLQKRYLEVVQYKSELAKLIIVPLCFIAICVLLYDVFPIFYPGGMEPFIVPIGFWLFIQRIVVLLVFEKKEKLKEALKMMGLTDFSYYSAYFLSEGLISGLVISFWCACLSMAHASDGDLGFLRYKENHLFNNGSFGDIFGLLFCFTLAAVPFAFFLSCFFDSPQNAGQVTLLLLLLFYVIFCAIKPLVDNTASNSFVLFLCLFPPLGLQIGCKSFLPSYQYAGLPNVSQISGIMIASIFMWSALTWYASQVISSEVGVSKPWYFLLLPEYWTGKGKSNTRQTIGGLELNNPINAAGESKIAYGTAADEENRALKTVLEEVVDESLCGKPTIVVRDLYKTFDDNAAVKGASLTMYENQIFVLLGHNGAGKTTTINMMTGLFEPDFNVNTRANIYGQSIMDDMDSIRRNLGVCPQHDVLFEKLSVREHIILASQIKGFSYEKACEEADVLTKFFHLDKRQDHKGSELSGGQKRKLSVAIAVSGGSKFIVLDEPTAGMDPLARREFWDLLTKLRKGRTVLLTTHYMDEADVLGDRIGIMNLGKLQCIGSTSFLKKEYGAGYKLVLDKCSNFNNDNFSALSKLLVSHIPEVKHYDDLAADNSVTFTIPFTAVNKFADCFDALTANLTNLNVNSYGIMLTSMEDVFLKIGEDHSVTPKENTSQIGIGSDSSYNATFVGQVIGIFMRRIKYASHDIVTIPMIVIPVIVFIAAQVINELDVISKQVFFKNLASCGMYYFSFLLIPGLIAEFLVRERSNRLRNVLTVMGCDSKAYWLGNLCADYILMLIPIIVLFITWSVGSKPMTDFSENKGGLGVFVVFLFIFQMIGFSYLCSYMFTSPVKCMIFMPMFNLLLLILPSIFVVIYAVITIQSNKGKDDDDGALQATPGYVQWGIMILSPSGALFVALLDISDDLAQFITSFPDVKQTIAIMVTETILFFSLAWYFDSLTISKENPAADINFNDALLDEDVKEERRNVAITMEKINGGKSYDKSMPTLVVSGLKKIFQAKNKNQGDVVAVENMSFQVAHNELFGLLGANGAGKTTTLSVLTRHLLPSFGNAFVSGHSVLSDFAKASTHLGVVTQNNSLWDLLSVEDHLFLFARLRGVPEDIVATVVANTIDQLQLTPHKKKLACKLSGGMKRKLCVAIALIGDPSVVLLDEPSAGLDPVSRRNLWNVILKTMSHRAVVLTTHSMEEAEALCGRIGIMVKGQCRAIGTKQHLKTKFSSGYEVTVKVQQTEKQNLEQCLAKFDTFIKGIFPRAAVIATNSALVTYRVPKDEMNVAMAFRSFEAHKESLCVVDYSISQPTLEQVFISTVIENSGDDFVQRGSISGINKMDLEGFAPLKDANPDHHDDALAAGSSPNGDSLTSPSVQNPAAGQSCMETTCCPDESQKLRCGCRVKPTHYLLYVLWLIFVIMFAVVFTGSGNAAVRFIMSITLILSLLWCCTTCCPCFRQPENED